MKFNAVSVGIFESFECSLNRSAVHFLSTFNSVN